MNCRRWISSTAHSTELAAVEVGERPAVWLATQKVALLLTQKTSRQQEDMPRLLGSFEKDEVGGTVDGDDEEEGIDGDLMG